MSDPIVTPADFGVYLGQDVDVTRATLILAKAQALCETIVTPLPAGADVVVLPVAARAYGNTLSMTQVGMGSAYGTFSQTGSGGVGGLYLSRSDKATLRRLAGHTGAFTVDLLPPAPA
jgi:hypothetical protein